MNASDCRGFEDVGSFFGPLNNWEKFSGKATYLLVCGSPIPRLQDASDILYIGHSSIFGGTTSSRLWNYRNAGKNTQEYRLMEIVGDLGSDGVTVSLHVCQEPPDGQTVREYESQLLSRYREEHWELPP